MGLLKQFTNKGLSLFDFIELIDLIGFVFGVVDLQYELVLEHLLLIWIVLVRAFGSCHLYFIACCFGYFEILFSFFLETFFVRILDQTQNVLDLLLSFLYSLY